MTKKDKLGDAEKTILLDGLILAGQFFWEPTLELAGQLKDGTIGDELDRLAGLLDSKAEQACRFLKDYGREFKDSDQFIGHLSEAHTRLFISARGNLSAPLYQSVYESEEGLLMGPAAREMERRLASLGLARGERLSEPADHLSIELEYLFRLLEKAFTEQKPEDRAKLASQAREFASATMAPWVARFNDRLAGETRCPFYPAAGRLVAGLLRFVGEI